jgi:hypothetical protein
MTSVAPVARSKWRALQFGTIRVAAALDLGEAADHHGAAYLGEVFDRRPLRAPSPRPHELCRVIVTQT